MLRSKTMRWTVLATVFALAECNVYDESMLLPGEGYAGAPPSASEFGVGWWSGKDPDTACFSARRPSAADRPSGTANGDVGPLVFAIRAMRLGSRNLAGELDPKAWQDIGFDLDGICTTSPTCPTTGEAAVSCKPVSATIPADGSYCRDNNFGNLEYLISTNADIQARFKLNDPSFNCSLCEGAYNILFRLTGYNGEPNDSSVRIDIYPSPGLDTLKPVDCSAESWDESACWTQEDRWQVQRDYVPSGTSADNMGDSTLYDPSAFVRDGYVVATLPANTLFWFPGNRGVALAFPLKVQGGVVTGKMVKQPGGTWEIQDGIIAGRLKSTDAIEAFQMLGLCKDDPLFAGAQLYASTFADVLSSGDTAPEATCDAISVGIAFSASLAKFGSLAEVAPLVPCESSDAGAGDAPTAPADAGDEPDAAVQDKD
jgi:hypothetical protein